MLGTVQFCISTAQAKTGIGLNDKALLSPVITYQDSSGGPIYRVGFNSFLAPFSKIPHIESSEPIFGFLNYDIGNKKIQISNNSLGIPKNLCLSFASMHPYLDMY